MKVRALIVDDEPPARSKLRRLLKQDDRVEIVGEARDGTEALEKIAATQPDLLFLDIQMPRLNGFEVLEALGPNVHKLSSQPPMTSMRSRRSRSGLWTIYSNPSMPRDKARCG